VHTRREYEERVLAPMYEALAPVDGDGVLRHEWLNARGAIARFDRSAIEIRLADSQECPRADVAIANAVSAVTRSLFEERHSATAAQASLPTARLAALLRKTIRDAEDAMVDDTAYLAALGLTSRARRARDVWRELLANADAELGSFQETVSFILNHGTLAARILRAAGEAPDRARLRDVYAELCDCLDHGRLFA